MRARWLLFLLIPLVSALPGCEGCGGCSVEDDFPVSGKDGLSFCRFGPKTKVLYPDRAAGDDSCSGMARVQSLTYRCDDAAGTAVSLAELYDVVEADARSECDKHCKAKASGCRGLFLGKGVCGLKTDADDARMAGARYKCPSGCDGEAFIFCSIYDAGYKLDDPALESAVPNCRCTRESP